MSTPVAPQIQTDPTKPDSLVGALVDGRYRVDAWLGEGAMGAVFRASQVRLERRVALKVPLPHLILDEHYRERFRREALATARLHHENIVQVHDVYVAERAGEISYIVLEYVEGKPLDHFLRAGQGVMTVRDSLMMFEGIARGLDAAHGAGIIHRDIKPGNIMVALPSNVPKVLDFGVARIEEAIGATRTGSSVGTPLFMAPEQVMGDKSISGAVDVYALAVTMYRELARLNPFAGDTTRAMMYAHVHHEPRPIHELNPALPPALDAALRRGLAKDPADRPPSALELVREVQAALAPVSSRIFSEIMPEVDGIRPSSSQEKDPSSATSGMLARFLLPAPRATSSVRLEPGSGETFVFVDKSSVSNVRSVAASPASTPTPLDHDTLDFAERFAFSNVGNRLGIPGAHLRQLGRSRQESPQYLTG